MPRTFIALNPCCISWATILVGLFIGPSAVASTNDATSPAPLPTSSPLDLETCAPEPTAEDCSDSVSAESVVPTTPPSATATLERLKERGVVLTDSDAYDIVLEEREGDLDVQLRDANKLLMAHFEIRVWSHVDSPAMGRNAKLAGQPVYKKRREHSDHNNRMMTTYIVESYKGFIFVMTVDSTIEKWFEANWMFD